MKNQVEMFPKTEIDEAYKVLGHLRSESEKAEKAFDAAELKCRECGERSRQQLHVIECLKKMGSGDGKSIAQVAVDMVNDGALDSEGMKVTASLNGVDPVTGEITEDQPVAVPTPVVIALYPGDDGPHVTIVGKYTCYSELVADYLAEVGLDDMTIEAYAVCREGVPDAPLDLTCHIVADDYGKRLVVSAKR